MLLAVRKLYNCNLLFFFFGVEQEGGWDSRSGEEVRRLEFKTFNFGASTSTIKSKSARENCNLVFGGEVGIE